MGELLYFPVRRIASLGLPGEAVEAIRSALPNVAVSSEGSALQKCDLLLIAESELGAAELVGWLREKSPTLPVVVARLSQPAGELVEHCRSILFEERGIPPATGRGL